MDSQERQIASLRDALRPFAEEWARAPRMYAGYVAARGEDSQTLISTTLKDLWRAWSVYYHDEVADAQPLSDLGAAHRQKNFHVERTGRVGYHDIEEFYPEEEGEND